MAGAYVHVPFCRSSCPYCDYFHVVRKRSTARFTQALCSEIGRASATLAADESISSIYFGGGTPSVLPHQELGRIREALEKGFSVIPDAEVSIECNPEDVDSSFARSLAGLGMNRVVLGAQSFYKRDLELLGRRHTGEDIQQAVLALRQAGIGNVSLDLMLAVPDQPAEYWAANLERAANLSVPHISTYELTLEPGAPLAPDLEARGLGQLSEEDRADQMLFTMDYLRSRGYGYYELTNYAKPGKESRHSALYSDHGNVAGFGPSAYSFWWHRLPKTGVRRWSNTRDLHAYTEQALAGRSVVEEERLLDPDRLAREYVMIRLRTSEGIDLEKLENDYGFDLLTERVEALAQLESEKLIASIRNGKLRLTDQGKLVCESVGNMLAP